MKRNNNQNFDYKNLIGKLSASLKIFDVALIHNKEEFEEYKKKYVKKRILSEKKIAEKNRKKKSFNIIGYCERCKKPTLFLIDWQYAYSGVPNFRERVVCKFCHLNNRQRFMANLLIKKTSSSQTIKTIYLHEQVTEFYSYIKSRLPNANLIGSEYLDCDNKSGEKIDGVLHEDVQNSSLEDSSVDTIVSNDVFEHVPNCQKAFEESYRILKSGGVICFSIPFDPAKFSTIKRADIDENGSIIHHLPPEIHGNPLSEKGSLVYYNFGWDILDMLKIAGFQKPAMLAYYSRLFGHVGNGVQYCFIAEK